MNSYLECQVASYEYYIDAQAIMNDLVKQLKKYLSIINPSKISVLQICTKY